MGHDGQKWITVESSSVLTKVILVWMCGSNWVKPLDRSNNWRYNPRVKLTENSGDDLKLISSRSTTIIIEKIKNFYLLLSRYSLGMWILVSFFWGGFLVPGPFASIRQQVFSFVLSPSFSTGKRRIIYILHPMKYFKLIWTNFFLLQVKLKTD